MALVPFQSGGARTKPGRVSPYDSEFDNLDSTSMESLLRKWCSNAGSVVPFLYTQSGYQSSFEQQQMLFPTANSLQNNGLRRALQTKHFVFCADGELNMSPAISQRLDNFHGLLSESTTVQQSAAARAVLEQKVHIYFVADSPFIKQDAAEGTPRRDRLDSIPTTPRRPGTSDSQRRPGTSDSQDGKRRPRGSVENGRPRLSSSMQSDKLGRPRFSSSLETDKPDRPAVPQPPVECSLPAFVLGLPSAAQDGLSKQVPVILVRSVYDIEVGLAAMVLSGGYPEALSCASAHIPVGWRLHELYSSDAARRSGLIDRGEEEFEQNFAEIFKGKCSQDSFNLFSRLFVSYVLKKFGPAKFLMAVQEVCRELDAPPDNEEATFMAAMDKALEADLNANLSSLHGQLEKFNEEVRSAEQREAHQRAVAHDELLWDGAKAARLDDIFCWQMPLKARQGGMEMELQKALSVTSQVLSNSTQKLKTNALSDAPAEAQPQVARAGLHKGGPVLGDSAEKLTMAESSKQSQLGDEKEGGAPEAAGGSTGDDEEELDLPTTVEVVRFTVCWLWEFERSNFFLCLVSITYLKRGGMAKPQSVEGLAAAAGRGGLAAATGAWRAWPGLGA
ncbi:hypothetical protein CYMTET_53201, partial [Cymbomonas tetramitiformis]